MADRIYRGAPGGPPVVGVGRIKPNPSSVTRMTSKVANTSNDGRKVGGV